MLVLEQELEQGQELGLLSVEEQGQVLGEEQGLVWEQLGVAQELEQAQILP